MTSPSYHDFELQLGPATGAGYALAARSPVGETRQVSIVSFSQANLAAWKQRPADIAAAREFGAGLFNAVFTGDALSIYDASGALARRDGTGLRLRLRILAPELAGLPWELLYDSRQEEFLAVSQQTRIVRAVETMQPLHTLSVTPPLRILGMAASPINVQPLDIAREQELLTNAATKVGGQIELVWTAGGSWRDLQERLQQGSWHIFHFIGHGLFDESTGEGALVLADERGQVDLRNTQEISRLLTDRPALRLVVLNACEGAHTGTQALYTSIAEHLVRRGLPAVLAMQDAITDTAAAEFTRSFYGALGNGLPVDAACTEARKAMSLAAPASWGWATPVLFLHGPDGELWTPAAETAGRNMDDTKTQPWWEQASNAVGSLDASNAAGDVIIAFVGAGAKNVAAGKNITQTVTEILGPPTPDDKKQIEQGFAKLLDALAGLQVDEAAADRAKMRIEILQEEVAKADDDVPNAGTIIKMGDWLLNNLPAIGEALGTVFALPAIGRVVGKAGDAAVKWVQQRFGSAPSHG
jgi:hypothetical protein